MVAPDPALYESVNVAVLPANIPALLGSTVREAGISPINSVKNAIPSVYELLEAVNVMVYVPVCGGDRVTV